jgi:tryptophan halogenase
MTFTIVGGGTAGWLSALYINKKFPDNSVTVIASSEIGILGAGEGTTPAFMQFLEQVEIPEQELYDNCKATIKRGIKFTNWNGEDDSYFHDFYQNRHALHFDASLLAKYLQEVAVSRGVTLLDDEVVDFKETDKIESLTLKSGKVVDVDFVFDCSGFRKLFLQNRKWNSYADSMPCKRAIPFFLPNDNENLPDYTESIAMKYGWVWKIPVQGRYGCGYVFDSNLTTDEEAKQEVRDWLGHDIEFPRVFNFSAGSYDEVWQKNCLAVGLSSGFIEPLEATSIWVQVLLLNLFGAVYGTEDGMEKLNSDVRDINEDVLSFLYFHYTTQRTDTEFWRDFKINNKMPQKLQELIQGASTDKYNFNLFPDQSWAAIAIGTRLTK